MIKLRHRRKKKRMSIKTMISTHRKTNINKYILNRYKNEQSTVSKTLQFALLMNTGYIL